MYFLFFYDSRPCQPRVCRYTITSRRKCDGTFEIPAEADFIHTCAERMKDESAFGWPRDFSAGFWCRAFSFTWHTSGSLFGHISVFHWKKNIHLVKLHNQQNAWASTLANGRLIFGQTTIRMSVIIVLIPIRFQWFHLLQSHTTRIPLIYDFVMCLPAIAALEILFHTSPDRKCVSSSPSPHRSSMPLQIFDLFVARLDFCCHCVVPDLYLTLKCIIWWCCDDTQNSERTELMACYRRVRTIYATQKSTAAAITFRNEFLHENPDRTAFHWTYAIKECRCNPLNGIELFNWNARNGKIQKWRER